MNNTIVYNLYSWYDIFIKYGTSKFITLFCDEATNNPKTGKKYLLIIDKYFSDNNIVFSVNFTNLKELNIIKVKISNKNEYSIYIKNGTKIAIAYETPNNLNNIFASNNNQANINEDNKFINYFNNNFKDNLSSNIYLSKKRNLKNKMKIKKSETNFNKINVQKFMNPVDYEKYIEEPIYGL